MIYFCTSCKSSKTVNETPNPLFVLCGNKGCPGRAWPEKPATKCFVRRSKGQGVIVKCTLEVYHKGPHIWADWGI